MKLTRGFIISFWIVSCVLLSLPAVAQVDTLPAAPLRNANNSLQFVTQLAGGKAFSAGDRPTSLAWQEKAQGSAAQSQPAATNAAGQEEEKPKENVAPSEEPDGCKGGDSQFTDCRGVFGSSFYIGLAIDTFAGAETLNYLNPGDSGTIHLRAVGGFDFGYRLLGNHLPKIRFRDTVANKNRIEAGDACDPSKDDCREISWHPRNLWVYGETVHGVRSADVNCTDNPDSPVCAKNLSQPPKPGEQLYAILRNATSLEGFMGLRWEFLGLQQASSSPASLYFKAQTGFLTVAGAPGTALDVAHVGLGAIATKGRYQDSYLEVGYGRNDVFSTARRKRVKVDGYLQRSVSGPVSFFTQLTVDTDLGRGSDALQTFIGFNFDLGQLFSKIPGAK